MNKFWNFVSQSDDTSELLLYGAISEESWYGDEVTPMQFAKDLMECGDKALTVRINSGGGDVFAAHAIAALLKAYKGPVTVRIDGLCASAATIVACAGDTTIMPQNALYMIHNPMIGMYGMYNADELAKMQAALVAVKASIVSVYKDKVGEDNFHRVAQLMDEESWLSADEAQALGLVDEIDSDAILNAAMNGNELKVNDVVCRITNSARVKTLLAKKEEPMEANELVTKIKNLLGIAEEKKSTAEVVPDATAKERDRLLALDALKSENAVSTAMIEVAKKERKSVDDVKPYLDAIAEPMKQYTEQAQALAAINALVEDNLSSGAHQITPNPALPPSVEGAAQTKEIDVIAQLANQLRGGK